MESNEEKPLPKTSLLDRWLNRKKENLAPRDIPARPDRVIAPLSLSQQRLWFLQQLFPDNPFYHYCDSYRFKGSFDFNKLIEALRILVKKHEIMRTTFPVVDGQPVQFIHENLEFDVSTFDLQHLPSEQRLVEGNSIARQQARIPFDLNNGPLTRITLIQLDNHDHLMLITMHHMITDKWSMEILHQDLSTTYQHLISGREIRDENTQVQYGDFAFWQRSQEVDKNSLAYWQDKLAGELPMLKLPFDHPRPVRPSFRGGLMERRIDRKVADKLKKLAKDSNTTSFVLLLSAFNVLLHRYSHQTDILVGTPFSNREKVALENVMGFFNDTLVLRSDLSGNPSFSDLLQQVRRSVLEAFSYKNIPFETLVKMLAPERDLASNPIFQVMFLYHKATGNTPFASDLQEEYGPFDFGVSKFDLTLYVSENEDDFSAIIEYAQDLFEPDTIERMHGHFAKLWEEIVAAPHSAISSFSILTDEERKQQLVEWNATEAPAQPYSAVHHLIEKQALEKPPHTALIFKDRQLSYNELNEKADTICADLLSMGVGRGDIVGICAYRSAEFIVAILGILKTGAAYLPLDPEYPLDRLLLMVKDASVGVLVADKKCRNLFTGTTVRICDIDKDFKDKNHHQPGKITPCEPDDLAYVIYTSGSTGKPKGVQVSHANLAHSTLARNSYYPEPPRAFLLLSSFSFDSSVAGIFWTLCSGGTLVISEEHIEQDMNRLASVVEMHKVTHTLLLPSLYAIMLQHAPAEMLTSLRTVIVAGEACSSVICRKHIETMPQATLYNEYGPTEATVWCTAHKITSQDTKGPVPIGRPITNTQLYILDSQFQPVPIGVAGELFIGGAGVTRGYLNQQELTAHAFVPDAFMHNGQRLYRTGDLCRYRNDGVIDYLGRADQQVKIRGYRIELDEIREALLDTPGVRDVEVVIGNEEMHTNEGVRERDRLVELLESLHPDEAERILQIIETIPEGEYAESSMGNQNQQAFTA